MSLRFLTLANALCRRTTYLNWIYSNLPFTCITSTWATHWVSPCPHHIMDLIKQNHWWGYRKYYFYTTRTWRTSDVLEWQGPSGKLGSPLFVDFNVGRPRMFDIWLQCSYKVIERFEMSAVREWWLLYRFPHPRVWVITFYRNTLPERWTIRNVRCLKNFLLHSHTRGYFWNVRRSACASGVLLTDHDAPVLFWFQPWKLSPSRHNQRINLS